MVRDAVDAETEWDADKIRHRIVEACMQRMPRKQWQQFQAQYPEAVILLLQGADYYLRACKRHDRDVAVAAMDDAGFDWREQQNKRADKMLEPSDHLRLFLDTFRLPSGKPIGEATREELEEGRTILDTMETGIRKRKNAVIEVITALNRRPDAACANELVRHRADRAALSAIAKEWGATP
jgi:hypothetical protein